MKLLANFLPIIIIYLIATYTPEAAIFAHTSLGKLFAITVILFYCSFDIITGLLVCAIVIVYYQSDYVESFEPVIEPSVDIPSNENQKEGFDIIEIVEEVDIVNLSSDDSSSQKINIENNEIVDFELLPDAYPLEPTQKIILDKTAKQFRKQFCKKGHLVHKGQIVKPEMSEHVFQEIEQDDYHKCNICDPSCKFNIIESNIRDEEDLIKPKSSNEWFETVWNNLRESLKLQ